MLFLGPISRLAPGALPLVQIRTPIEDAAAWGMAAGFGCLIAAACSGWLVLALAGGLIFAASLLVSLAGTRYMLFASVQFGELQTFRDLAIVLANERPDGELL
jgi:hypothetical protein